LVGWYRETLELSLTFTSNLQEHRRNSLKSLINLATTPQSGVTAEHIAVRGLASIKWRFLDNLTEPEQKYK
jgi:hypothetical protein